MRKIIFSQFILPIVGLFMVYPIANFAQVIKNQPKKVMLMNRIGPSNSTLFIANANGTNEHPLFDKSGLIIMHLFQQMVNG